MCYKSTHNVISTVDHSRNTRSPLLWTAVALTHSYCVSVNQARLLQTAYALLRRLIVAHPCVLNGLNGLVLAVYPEGIRVVAILLEAYTLIYWYFNAIE